MAEYAVPFLPALTGREGLTASAVVCALALLQWRGIRLGNAVQVGASLVVEPEVLSGGRASTLALQGSTEAAQFTAADTVGRAQRVIDEDHERLHEITRRIRQTHDLGVLAEALDDLNEALVEHFAHEEHPQGLYAVLGTRAPEVRQKVAAILAEHARILDNVQSLVLKARRPEGEHRSLAEQAALLANLLGDHEKRENQVARAVLGPAGHG